MKKTLTAVLYTVVMLFGFVLIMTFSGDGISIDALRYSDSKNALVAALENENFSEAAEYLSFYGKKDTALARKKWAQDMEESGIAFRSIKRKNLITDDGITLCPVESVSENGEEICFRIIVQGNGLAITTVIADDSLRTDYKKIMTTYNPG